jgi:hypothetical protein
MPRYFMHLMDEVEHVLDEEGTLLSEQDIPGATLLAARDCMAGDVHSGRLRLSHRIDVHNEAGELVHSLLFRDAVEIA